MEAPILQLAEAPTAVPMLALLADLASVVIAAAMLILVLGAALLFARLNRAIDDLRTLARDNLRPVSDRARIISDNVEFITQALRSDVDRLNASVQSLSARLNQASARMEERIEDFNALMEVVQGEAEDLFLDTAATVRGVRAGAQRMSTRGPGASTPSDHGEVPDASDAQDHGPDAEALNAVEGDADQQPATPPGSPRSHRT